MERNDAMVLMSFIGDSLALGVHWIYDVRKLAGEYGRVESFLAPRDGSYHAGKAAGDFTHYGDQALVLLESVSARRGFDLEDFSDRWRVFFTDYKGYFDQATKGTLAGYRAGKPAGQAGSPSNDLAGAARIAPVIRAHTGDPDRMVVAAREQTAMTHTDPATVEAAAYFARVAVRALDGAPLPASLAAVAAEHHPGTPLEGWVRQGLDSIGEDSVAAIGRFGRSCHAPDAFPGVIHLAAKYAEDPREGLIQAVMAGGDNAARAMLTGLLLGAANGPDSLPANWSDALRARDRIVSLLGNLAG